MSKEQEKRESEPKPTPLKFYIAGSFSEREKIRDLMNKIEEMSHEIITDWTTHLPIKPYEDNLELANQYANEDIRGATHCNIFILKPAKEGGGTQFAELGAAINSERVKRIFVVGLHSKRSVVFFHPKVERVNSIEELLEKIAQLKIEKPQLTSRQIEVLTLAAQGLTNRQIAQKLKISPQTVRVHFAARTEYGAPGIFERLRVESRTEAVVKALQLGIIDLDEIYEEK